MLVVKIISSKLDTVEYRSVLLYAAAAAAAAVSRLKLLSSPILLHP